MERFAIEADIYSPAIIRTLTLDALLGAELFDSLQDIEAAHAAIPLRQTDGLYHASAAELIGNVVQGKHALIAGLRATHDLQLDLIEQNKNGQPHRQLGLRRRSDFGNVMNAYETCYAASVRWYAEGDPERVLELLENIQFIGKKRTAGFGEVSNWHLLESPLDGITAADGSPLRPVPLHMWHGREDVIRADAAWRPAYWDVRNRAICAVPSGARI